MVLVKYYPSAPKKLHFLLSLQGAKICRRVTAFWTRIGKHLPLLTMDVEHAPGRLIYCVCRYIYNVFSQ